jgi:hypothetical protein
MREVQGLAGSMLWISAFETDLKNVREHNLRRP